MNKQTHTKFNLNNFLMALSGALDEKISNNKYEVKYSSKMFAYIALSISHKLEFPKEMISDIFSYSIIYKNDFLIQNIMDIPFNKPNIQVDSNVNDLFLLSNIVCENIKIQNNIVINANEIIDLIKKNNSIEDIIKNTFINISSCDNYWFTLNNSCKLPFIIFDFLDDFTQEIDFNILMSFTGLIHDLTYAQTNRTLSDTCIDQKASILCDYFKFEPKDKARFIISCHLHNIGLLFIENEILNLPKKINNTQYQIIKSAPSYTHAILSQIYGFDDIADLASSYCEKTNASGYPNNLNASKLSLKHRLIGMLCTYQSLSEKRTYRNAYTKDEICNILQENKFTNELIEVAKIL